MNREIHYTKYSNLQENTLKIKVLFDKYTNNSLKMTVNIEKYVVKSKNYK